MDYFILSVLWVLWCAVHSGMISLSVIGWIKKKFPGHFRFYRLFYNLFALATVVPLVLYTMSLKGPILFRWEGYMVVLQVILAVTGVLLFVAGARHYDTLLLLGIRQIRQGNSQNTLSRTGELDTSGILGVIRHPWYLGAMMLLWALIREFCVSMFIMNVILTVYLVVGTVLEERKLVVEFGDAYRRYQERVSMLIPVKWIRQMFHHPLR